VLAQAAFNASYRFPNAVYLDALADGGHVRTGTRRLSDLAPPGTGSGPICALFQWTPCLSDAEAAAGGNGGCDAWVDPLPTNNSSQDPAPRGTAPSNGTTTPNGDRSPWAVFDSGGNAQAACYQPPPASSTPASSTPSSSTASSSSNRRMRADGSTAPSLAHRRCCRDADANHASDSFAYADLLVAATAKQGCAMVANANANDDVSNDDAALAACWAVAAAAEARYWRHPAARWDDPDTGRLRAWPNALTRDGPPLEADTYKFLEPRQ
jgi:hypothetical protein